ncbi:MAG TPA: hypothetical protein VJ508_14795, partial [Saprospiraceae bacterium]|nr:hypothetical protein [Saprospiraceae bacterium]
MKTNFSGSEVLSLLVVTPFGQMTRVLLITPLVFLALFLRAQPSAEEIKTILDRNKETLGLSQEDLVEYNISSAYTTSHLGVTHVYLEQAFRDIPLYNGILNLNLKGSELISFGNRWIPGLAHLAPSNEPTISAQTAIALAAVRLSQSYPNAVEIRSETNKPGQVVKVFFSPGLLSKSEIPVTLTWWKEEPKSVRLCW